MKFVFDLDGTLSFDYMTIDEEIKQVLLTAPIEIVWDYWVRN